MAKRKPTKARRASVRRTMKILDRMRVEDPARFNEMMALLEKLWRKSRLEKGGE